MESKHSHFLTRIFIRDFFIDLPVVMQALLSIRGCGD